MLAVSASHPFPIYHAPGRCAEVGGGREQWGREEWKGEGEKWLRGFHSLSKTPTPLFGKAAQLFLILRSSQPRPMGWGTEALGMPRETNLC